MGQSSTTDFLQSLGASEMAQAITERGWGNTPPGPVPAWTGSLKTAGALVLRSTLAMALLRGKDGVMIYNDAYARVAGTKRKEAVGHSVFEVWPESQNFRDVLNRVLMRRVIHVSREIRW